jgi:hypothetical protein
LPEHIDGVRLFGLRKGLVGREAAAAQNVHVDAFGRSGLSVRQVDADCISITEAHPLIGFKEVPLREDSGRVGKAKAGCRNAVIFDLSEGTEEVDSIDPMARSDQKLMRGSRRSAKALSLLDESDCPLRYGHKVKEFYTLSFNLSTPSFICSEAR